MRRVLIRPPEFGTCAESFGFCQAVVCSAGIWLFLLRRCYVLGDKNFVVVTAEVMFAGQECILFRRPSCCVLGENLVAFYRQVYVSLARIVLLLTAKVM